MKTVCIQIGNSDDKLTQQQWSDYVNAVVVWTTNYVYEVHFSGGSQPEMSWQNYCSVCNIPNNKIDTAMMDLIKIRKLYNQESIAVLIGDTKFI